MTTDVVAEPVDPAPARTGATDPGRAGTGATDPGPPRAEPAHAGPPTRRADPRPPPAARAAGSGSAAPGARRPVHAVPVGPAMLLHTGRDATGPLTTMTSRLPAEGGRVLVVTAPAVSARDDYTELVARLLEVWPADPDTGVRLVPLGPRHDPAAAEAAVRGLADATGREIAGPLGTVTVAVDGTTAVSTPSGAPGGWVTYTPCGPPRYQPAWYPLPSWGADLPAETTTARDAGGCVVHPVPAGFWILPSGTRPGGAGAAACLPPGDAPAVFLGGHGPDPLPAGAVKRALRGLPDTGETRLVLLPGALADGSGYTRLRRTHRRGRITAGVPVWSPERQWELATVDRSGRVAWRPPVEADSRQRLAVPRRPAGGSDEAPPEPADRYGTGTAAGWSFLHRATPVGVIQAVAGYVVEIETDVDGFRLGGQPAPPATLANRIADLALGRTPLVVVWHGPPVTDADARYGELARLLGRPVTAATDEVAVSPTGILYSSGSFDTWQATGSDSEGQPVIRRRDLGATLPPLSSAPTAEPPSAPPAHAGTTQDGLAGTAPATPPPRAEPHQPHQAEPPQAEPPETQPPETEPFETEPPRPRQAGPSATPDPTLPDVDGTRLRQVLGDSYGTHQEAVSQALAQDPDAVNPADSDTDLVAVRAYASAGRDAVNPALRDGRDPVNRTPRGGRGESAVIARAVASGLRRLPLVFGPVFATSTADPVPQGYRTGLEYVEPGFVDVDLFPGASDGARLSYVIWSATARRLGGLSAGAPDTAVFPPGTRFRVLDVDRTGGRLRVLLLDLAPPGAYHPLDELRAAAQRADTASRLASGLVSFPIGM